MSDYVEPKAGQWVVVSNVEDGDVDVRRVEKVTQEPGECRILTLSDHRTWNAETGEPLMRAWKGHRIRELPEWEVGPMISRVLNRNKVPHDTLCAVLGMLLQGERR